MGDKKTRQFEMTELFIPRHTPYITGGEPEIKESEILPRGDWNCFAGSHYMSK
jgi:hypothetical protein